MKKIMSCFDKSSGYDSSDSADIKQAQTLGKVDYVFFREEMLSQHFPKYIYYQIQYLKE